MRSVPRGFPKREVFPHLVWLGRCKGIRMTGLNFLHAPSWTFTLSLKDVEVLWGWPTLDSWKSALNFEEVKGLEMSGVVCQAAPAPASAPAMSFDRVAGALVRGCRALDNTRVFLRVTGAASKDIRLEVNDLARAQIPCEVDKSVGADTVSGVEVKTGTP
jgi:hypothetical protein